VATVTSASSTTEVTLPPTVLFSVTGSGFFSDDAIWSGGVAPNGECLIYIGRGFTVSISNGALAVYARSIIVEGKLYLEPSPSNGFSFAYPVNIIVYSVGTVQMGFGPARINCPTGSVFSFLAGSTFDGNNTQIYAFTFSPADATPIIGVRFNRTMRRPVTYDVWDNRTSQIFPRVTLIVRENGSFSNERIWSGFLAPQYKFCDDVGGCGLHVPSDVTLSMASLNGLLSLNFAMITIMRNAVLQVGSIGSSAGFRFAFPLRLDCFGTFQDMTGSSGGIRVRFNSSMNFFTDSSFVGSIDTALRSYNANNAGNTVNSIVWPATFSGPVFYQVSENGSITSGSTRKFRNYQFCFSSVSLSIAPTTNLV
jgi:hypothetical protein